MTKPEPERLLTPGEVAHLFHVDPKTVTRWADTGKLSYLRTVGGHRRFRETEVMAVYAGVPQERAEVMPVVGIAEFRGGLTGGTVSIEHGAAAVRKDGHLEGILGTNAKGAALANVARKYAAETGATFLGAAS